MFGVLQHQVQARSWGGGGVGGGGGGGEFGPSSSYIQLAPINAQVCDV